ncbi:MAG: lipoprotein [Rickettsiaceae bacterium]|jgi:outer membrane protein assembly factor BamD|nr:lipoprotein [Rickettsiaceae bacterium]
MRIYYILALSLVLSLSGCKNKMDENDIVVPANDLYTKGNELLDKKDYKEAAETFSKIYFQHPGSPLTPKAELMEAYAYYLAEEYEEATDVLDNFIHLHPLHPEIDYAYYLRAMSYYMLIPNVDHDQNKTKEAKLALEEVAYRFPNSKYAADAKAKLALAIDHLAGHEMQVGRYYLREKNPIAAINRFKTVIEEYSATAHVQEALHRMVESYLILGLSEEAAKYASVLGHNYPESDWYRHSLAILKK